MKAPDIGYQCARTIESALIITAVIVINRSVYFLHEMNKLALTTL